MGNRNDVIMFKDTDVLEILHDIAIQKDKYSIAENIHKFVDGNVYRHQDDEMYYVIALSNVIAEVTMVYDISDDIVYISHFGQDMLIEQILKQKWQEIVHELYLDLPSKDIKAVPKNTCRDEYSPLKLI